jgi:hypothetical protein
LGTKLWPGRGGHPGGVLQRRTALARPDALFDRHAEPPLVEEEHRQLPAQPGAGGGRDAGRPQNRNSLPEVYPDGFNALRRIFELDFQTTVGARGVAKGWDWDLSTTFAQDHAQLDGQNTLNATLGPDSPTYFHLSTHQFQQWTTNLDVTREFEGVLPGRSRCRGAWSSATSTS